MTARSTDSAADLPGSGELAPREPRTEPIRPVLVSGEGLPPAERERRRLELRRQWSERLLKLTRETQDALNLDNPIATCPAFPWISWLASTNYDHPELRYHRWAYILEDGTVLRAYSVDILIRLKWVVEILQPLMIEEGIVIPLFCETRSGTWGGGRSLPMVHRGCQMPEVIELSSKCANDADLLYCALHELAHGQSSSWVEDPEILDGTRRMPSTAEQHNAAFRDRFGRLLDRFLETAPRDADARPRLHWLEDRWLRAYAGQDTYAPPRRPGDTKLWEIDSNRRYLVCPYPVNNPPAWARWVNS